MATPKKDWKKEWEAVSKESRKLAKRANQRLVRLEQYSEREGLSEILKFSYEKATSYIEKNLGVGRSGKARYKEHVKLFDVSDGTELLEGDELYKANVMIQRNRIKAMKEFLGSDTSTLGQARAGAKTRGIKNIYSQRTQTINERFLKEYGLEMSDSDLKRFFESKKQAKLASIVGSDQMFVVAAVMKKFNLKSNKRDLEKFMKTHVDLSQYELDPSDLKAQKGESYKEYLDRLQDVVSYTDDEVLDDLITSALQEGINVDNIFLD